MHKRQWTRIRLMAASLALLGTVLIAGPAARAQSTQPNPQVRVTTSLGSFVIELRPDRAPLTVANFLRYVNKGFYTNTLFHRVVTNFIIQGGGHEATPPYALKPTDPPVVNESGNGLENKRGTVGMARAAGPDTGNSQFYVNLVDNPELDPLPTRWGYAVFGKVIEGMDVVDRIGEVPTGAFGPLKANAPLTPVVIESIQVINAAQAGASQSTPSSAPASKPATPAAPGQSVAPPAASPAAPGAKNPAPEPPAPQASGSSPPGANATAKPTSPPNEAAGATNPGP